ncbi:MAG: hypothetical protein AUJ41_02880 [Candidatus Pacebacteria bacterium CG1_02_43_31]|nr:MAG: hypothetical protein AUJ41_02880 [Candidatus Pacebacteria bacterium CG1_02_43_31]
MYDQLIAKQGYEVEALAKEFLQQKVAREYPAGSTIDFQYQLTDGSYEAKIDVLIHNVVNNTYDLYEIKSSTKIDKQNKYDVTFQHLIAKSTLPVNKTYLVHVNSDYVKNGEIDVSEFFVIVDMSEVILKLENEVFQLRNQALAVTTDGNPPLESHCYKPNDCPCLKLCHPNLSEHPVYDLSWWKVGQYEKLVASGYQHLQDIPETEELNPKQILQIRSIKQNQPIIDYEGVQRELVNLTFPLYFFDYETINPAIPAFDGYKPYQHIVFQYSLHVMENPDDSELKHYEFLMTDKREPSKEITEELLKVIGSKGSVIVWNKSFERGRNKELGLLQPMYADEFALINERIFDLMEIFSKGLYMDYRFHGSASIKKVLPVLVPNLSYADLEIGEGATAMTKWWEMVNGNADTDQTARDLCW